MNSCNDDINRNSEWFERPQVIILDPWAPRRDSEAPEPHRSTKGVGKPSIMAILVGRKGKNLGKGVSLTIFGHIRIYG